MWKYIYLKASTLHFSKSIKTLLEDRNYIYIYIIKESPEGLFSENKMRENSKHTQTIRER